MPKADKRKAPKARSSPSSTRATKKGSPSPAVVPVAPSGMETEETAAGTKTQVPVCSDMVVHVTQHDNDQEEESEADDSEEYSSEEEEASEEDESEEYSSEDSEISHVQQHHHQQQQQPHESNDNEEIASIKTRIANTEALRLETLSELAEIKPIVKEATAALEAFTFENISTEELFVRFPFTRMWIKPSDGRDDQAQALRTYLANKAQLQQTLHAKDNGLFELYRQDLNRLDKVKLELQALNQNVPFQPQGSGTSKESGIFYVQDKCRIGMANDNSSSIGLLELEDDKLVKLKQNIPKCDLSKMLEKGWAILGVDISKKKFLNLLLDLVPRLSKSFVRNAWLSLNAKYKLRDESTAGEMSFEQCFCTPFITLLMAAAGKDGFGNALYRADEYVYSSLSIAHKEKEADQLFQVKKLAIEPDSAATLRRDWDAFGMMEIKPKKLNKDRSNLIDNDRCVLMTAVTALVIKRCIKESEYDKVVLPFIIWTGHYASLYVTTLDKQGNPTVSTVRYPCGDHGNMKKVSKSPCLARTKLFLAFAVILNDFKDFFESSAKKKYKRKVCSTFVDQFPSFTPTARTTGGSMSSKKGNDKSGTMTVDQVTSSKQSAQEAAECGGLFVALENILEEFLHLGTEDEEHTISSPFYFRGRSAQPAYGMTSNSKDVFLKVWREDEVDIDLVRSEWMHHQRAFKAGVPVALPVLSELAQSTCSRGWKYFVFAVEFIEQDDIKTMSDVWHFCCSLVQSVLTLHQKAKMLHGDLKPANLLWNRGIVRLIDFEHSQDIAEAKWAPGTYGYQAPEILNGMPCSTKTDAFSVGKTVSWVLERFGKRKRRCREQHSYRSILQEVSRKLTESDADKRWSLSDALDAMQNSEHSTKSQQRTVVVHDKVPSFVRMSQVVSR